MEQDRRGFLKSAGAAAFTTAVIPGGIRGANHRVNIAFIGMGSLGSRNLAFAGSSPAVNVAAVCDVSQLALSRAIAQAKNLGHAGVQAAMDFREILADPSIDAVCISTPAHWRAYIAVEACKAGKDVWVEAPACAFVGEGVKMVQAARQYRRVVQAGTAHRSAGFLRRAREIVKSGVLGDVTYCRAALRLEPARRLPFGAMADWGVHLLDIVQFAFDEAMPLSVAAQGSNFYGADGVETPGTVQATYRYPGFVASYERLTANPDSLDTSNMGVTFHGAKATLMVSGFGYRLYLNNDRIVKLEESTEFAEMHMSHWANFLGSIRSREKPVSDIETCVRSTTTSLLADLACRHSITLDWQEKSFTVKQTAIRPLLSAQDARRGSWRSDGN